MKVKLNCNGIEFIAEISDEDIKKLMKNKQEEFEKEIKRAEVLYNNMLRRSNELCEKIDWNNRKQLKYSIAFSYSEKCLFIDSVWFVRAFGFVYFDTKEHAQQVMEEFRDELIWYFTEFKERMD